MQVSREGAVQDFFTDMDGDVVASVSHAAEHGGKLWLGNLHGNYVSYIELSNLKAGEQLS